VLRGWAAADPARSLVIIRPTLVFGAGVRGHMQVLFHQLARPAFTMIGAGANRKSFAQVDNVAAFHAHMRHAGPGTSVFNYVDGPDLTMAELTDVIRTTLGLGPPRSHRAPWIALVRAAVGADALSVAQVRRFSADSRFISTRVAATGFRPALALREAISLYAHSDLRWAVLGAAAPPLSTVRVHPA